MQRQKKTPQESTFVAGGIGVGAWFAEGALHVSGVQNIYLACLLLAVGAAGFIFAICHRFGDSWQKVIGCAIVAIVGVSSGWYLVTHAPSKEGNAASSVQVDNSPGSIIAPSGGHNSITNVSEKPDRTLSDADKQHILLALTGTRTGVDVGYLSGSSERQHLAEQIVHFLQSQGYVVPQMIVTVRRRHLDGNTYLRSGGSIDSSVR
jgi:hypothetical protein